MIILKFGLTIRKYTMTLKTGTQAPDFTLKNSEGEDVTLSNYKGSENVVILFFPLAFTSVCTAELCQTRDNMKIYNEFNAKVVGISVKNAEPKF
jgi:peroxiredoxin